MIPNSPATDRAVAGFGRCRLLSSVWGERFVAAGVPAVVWVGTITAASLGPAASVVAWICHILQCLIAIAWTLAIASRFLRTAPRASRMLGVAAIALILYGLGQSLRVILHLQEARAFDGMANGLPTVAVMGLLAAVHWLPTNAAWRWPTSSQRLDLPITMVAALDLAWAVRFAPVGGAAAFTEAIQLPGTWAGLGQDALSLFTVWIGVQALFGWYPTRGRASVRTLALAVILVGVAGLLTSEARIGQLPAPGMLQAVLVGTALVLWTWELASVRWTPRAIALDSPTAGGRHQRNWPWRFEWIPGLLWPGVLVSVYLITPRASAPLGGGHFGAVVLNSLLFGLVGVRHIVEGGDRNRLVRRLQEELDRRQASEIELNTINATLAEQVLLRTAELVEANRCLRCEIDERLGAEAALQASQARLLYGAAHDPLTDLPNRAVLLERIRWAMEKAQQNPGFDFVLMFLDIDSFRLVNDTLGNTIGDSVLVECAQRLQKALRGSDTLARIGGDEFAILMEDIQNEESARVIASRLQAIIAAPLDGYGQRIYLSASVGIVLEAARVTTANDLLVDAEVTMYHAKVIGKMGVAVFQPQMRAHLVNRQVLESELRQAIERQELFLQYQPILDLRTRRAVGFEALLRWRHPYRGLVPPSEFIPIAEENGTIVAIGQWVLQEATRQLARWRAQSAAAHQVTMAVNLSARQFREVDLVDQIAVALDQAKLEAAALRIEVTETALIDDAETVLETLLKLRALGVQVQIDDFGTGYSSLSYLQRFPLDSLKIDRSFVGGIEGNPEAVEIIRSIVNLSHVLGLTVVAEGIENQAQLEQVNALACELGQGFLFSRAIDPEIAWAAFIEPQAAPPLMPPTGPDRSAQTARQEQSM